MINNKSAIEIMVNIKVIAAICIIIILIVAGIVFGYSILDGVGPIDPQPIDFNHKLHLERAQGITCTDCHQYANTQTFAGIPSKYVCMDCHDADVDESDTEADANKPQFAVLMEIIRSENDIPWHRVTATREDVFFSHRRHVTVGKLECIECHPKMPDREKPPARGPIVISMNACLDCHKKYEARVDCIVCHR